MLVRRYVVPNSAHSCKEIWITLRTIGAENIRRHVRLAKIFENKVRSDTRFEIVARPVLGLVCFRLKRGCESTKILLEKITERKNFFMIRSKCYEGKLMIRFTVCGFAPEERDTDFAWNEIAVQASGR